MSNVQVIQAIQLDEQNAIRAFSTLDANVPAQGDNFFIQFGCGNVIAGLSQPFERLLWYERLLEITRAYDEVKFSQMHKGQAYHLMAWIAYQMQNFDTSLYYLDNAIAEDIRSFGDNWKTSPASSFFKLTPQTTQEGELVTNSIINKTRQVLAESISAYHTAHGSDALTVDTLAQRLFNLVVEQPETRSLVSTLYVFSQERRRRSMELQLRSQGGGSIAPFLTYLFKGCVCLETLLKIYYGGTTLGNVYSNSTFKTDFGFSNLGSISASTLADVISTCSGNTIVEKFQGTGKLRNTAGHNLVWDDIFCTPTNYDIAFQAVMDSILRVVVTKVPMPDSQL